VNLPTPGTAYDAGNEAQARNIIRQEDGRNQKRGSDAQFNGDATITGPKLIIVSPNGTRYRVLVNNAGTLSTVAI
jgi:hypothetical protein